MATLSKGFRVLHKLESPYSVLLENRAEDDSLMFESGAIAVLTCEETEYVRRQYTKVADGYGCLGVLSYAHGEEAINYLVLVTGCLSVGKIGDSEIFRVTTTQFISLRNQPTDEEYVNEVRRLLNSGTFYFSWSSTGDACDLSLCAQRRVQRHDTDNRFFWNRMLHVQFLRYGVDCSKWLFKVMCGGVEIRTIYAAHQTAKACLISRLSCERAGTRFNVRGTNDDGHVANFVETEQVIYLEDAISSFVQTRGSVPLFWEQPGIQVGSHKIKMSRGYETSAPAFDRHLTMIRQQYGEQVVVNLLGCKEGESMLSLAYQNHHKASPHKDTIPHISFDYHTECRSSPRNIDKLKRKLLPHIDVFGYFFTDGSNVQKQQTGGLRTNCVDCLDRTNAVQTMVALHVLPRQLDVLGLASKSQMISRFDEVYKQIWSLNGDHVSKIYAGTGALGGGRSKYSDVTRSATRTIQNNFLDNSKQEAIDILLVGSTLRGELADKARAYLSTRNLHAPVAILRSMLHRHHDYATPSPLRVNVATWNVNGGKHFRSILFKDNSLSDWLLDAAKIHRAENQSLVDIAGEVDDRPPDIFAVGFEEIVDLNASNVMSASSTNAQEWQKEILKTVHRDNKYVLLTSAQLVGVFLCIIVRPHLAPFIRDVACDQVKTGLGGAAGNKGGVAIRFLIHSTSVCFVCAHLAAGQSQVTERNSDYHDISRRVSFPMGRGLNSHDYVFWCGDFNYRIDLPNAEIKSLVADQNWTALTSADQLTIQRSSGNVFRGFNEGTLDFPPTYKYDIFSDDYDTSEKMRRPAWTDRVLWRRRPIISHPNDATNTPVDHGKLLLYTRSLLRTSDHRPVIAIFDVNVDKVTDSTKDQVLREVISSQGPSDGTVIVSLDDDDEEFDDDTIEEVLEKFGDIGEILLVRFVGAAMWLIYRTGQHALEALTLTHTQINDKLIKVQLKTPNWMEGIQKELSLCTLNTGSVHNVGLQHRNSLLSDDVDVETMDYDMNAYFDEEMGDIDMLQPSDKTPVSSGRTTPVGLLDDTRPDVIPPERPTLPPDRPAPPTRPQPPTKRPTPTEATETQPPEKEKKQPPARPKAPPKKPPPPKIVPGQKPLPPVINAQPATKAKVRPPMRPKPSDKSRGGNAPHISAIGLPTNVQHVSHASSSEEAQRIIERLMNYEQKMAQLDAPLVPKGMHKSHTSEDIHSLKDSNLTLPQAMPRFHSVENIAGDDRKTLNESKNFESKNEPVTTPTPRPRTTSRENLLSGSTDLIINNKDLVNELNTKLIINTETNESTNNSNIYSEVDLNRQLPLPPVRSKNSPTENKTVITNNVASDNNHVANVDISKLIASAANRGLPPPVPDRQNLIIPNDDIVNETTDIDPENTISNQPIPQPRGLGSTTIPPTQHSSIPTPHNNTEISTILQKISADQPENPQNSVEISAPPPPLPKDRTLAEFKADQEMVHRELPPLPPG